MAANRKARCSLVFAVLRALPGGMCRADTASHAPANPRRDHASPPLRSRQPCPVSGSSNLSHLPRRYPAPLRLSRPLHCADAAFNLEHACAQEQLRRQRQPLV